jgi:hypothetical protein
VGADVIATTRSALLRTTVTKDGIGDDVDDFLVVPTPPNVSVAGRSYADFPASIIERSRREFDEASNQWRTVRYFAGRVPAYVPVKAGDALRDNVSGALYVVLEGEGMARGLAGRSSVTLTMKRTAP